MAPSISPSVVSDLRTYIDSVTSGAPPKLPGAIIHIVNADNTTIFGHTSGGTQPLSCNTTAVVHSLTKLVGAVAYMQLVERGLASLDSIALVTEHLPELVAKEVLTGFEEVGGKKIPIFVQRQGDITPRMLMNHTYGGGHTFFNEILHEYLKDGWDNMNEANDPHQTILRSPLLWQPGTHANYGQGFDWLAVLIERITRQDLKSYLEEHIFSPLNLKGVGYEDTFGGDFTNRGENRGLFWPRSFKGPDGTFSAMDPPVLKKVVDRAPYPGGTYHAYPLGTGLVSSAPDYTRVLTLFLNEGVDPVTGRRLLSPQSVKEITSPQLPEQLRNDSRIVPSALPGIVFPSDQQKEDMDPQGSWGFGCGVQGADRVLKGRRGRSKGSLYWYGAANTEFWVDGEKGIAVFLNGNYFPWNDKQWVNFVAEIESRVYQGLS